MSNKGNQSKKEIVESKSSPKNRNHKEITKNTGLSHHSNAENKEEYNKTKGINTTFDYDFHNDPNRNINDISNSDKVLYFNDNNKELENQPLNSSKLETKNQLDSEGNEEKPSSYTNDKSKSNNNKNNIKMSIASRKEVKPDVEKEKEIDNKSKINSKNDHLSDINRSEDNKNKNDDYYLLPDKLNVNLDSLKKQLKEKQEIYEYIKNKNLELESHIKEVNDEYNDICKQLKDKPFYENEKQIIQKIQETEKEIQASNAELEFYKKKIDSVKNKIEFKANLEKAMNLESLVKTENNKNKELKQEYNNLVKLNNAQAKKLSNLDSENRYLEKIKLLNSEIKNIKESIKKATDKYTKQDKFLKLMHEKIAYIETQAKKLNYNKLETVKHFTKEDLKTVLFNIDNIRKEINNNRDNIRRINKENEMNIKKLKDENKALEEDYSKKEEVNKSLIFERNELKRLIKLISEGKGSRCSKLDLNKIQRIIKNFKEKNTTINKNIEDDTNQENFIEDENENNKYGDSNIENNQS